MPSLFCIFVVEIFYKICFGSHTSFFVFFTCIRCGVLAADGSCFVCHGFVLDITGINFCSIGDLIGKRGQTLDSLQYLTNLAINKHSDTYTRVKLDTEDYRKRRKDTLENLAKNIAYNVKRTKKAVSLEPMNPFERRVIHSALQNDRYVSTHSEGDEPYRHVVITLKRQ